MEGSLTPVLYSISRERTLAAVLNICQQQVEQRYEKLTRKHGAQVVPQRSVLFNYCNFMLDVDTSLAITVLRRNTPPVPEDKKAESNEENASDTAQHCDQELRFRLKIIHRQCGACLQYRSSV